MHRHIEVDDGVFVGRDQRAFPDLAQVPGSQNFGGSVIGVDDLIDDFRVIVGLINHRFG